MRPDRFKSIALFGLVLGLGGCAVAFQQCDEQALTLDNGELALPGDQADCRVVENLGDGIYRIQCDGNRTGYIVR